MQFIKDGPDVPEQLLQAHEDGRVIFFCGAGISYPAGLPGFRELVEKIYAELGEYPSDIENQALSKDQFDAVLELLQQRIQGHRRAVRSALMRVLKPNLRKRGATDTHDALLRLALDRNGVTRLVTTNFDRIFERQIKREHLAVSAYPAPLLPIPKNSRWSGIVYLHGLIPEIENEAELNRLVVSSGDFGLAYLTERWAARFVSELFRNYVVCFVGYSINDPVLRYMMDALAADRMLGESTPPAYAFGEYASGEKEKKRIEWEAKGVEPVLYMLRPDFSHAALHQTLKTWSEVYRDGVQGKEKIVADLALNRPQASTKEDDLIGRMMWALCDPSGLPAKLFAEFEPTPKLEWLDHFSEDRYHHADLERFGVQIGNTKDEKLLFSLTRRPTPFLLAPRMSLASFGYTAVDLDNVMYQLARWLARNLNDPALLWWLSKNGGRLHDRLARLIEQELTEVSRLEREGKAAELEHRRLISPYRIPSAPIRKLWRQILTGRARPANTTGNVFGWRSRFLLDGLTRASKFQLREILTPRISWRQPFQTTGSDVETEPKHIRDLVEWEIELSEEHVRSTLIGLANNPSWVGALPTLLGDVQQLLLDALELMRELEDDEDASDRGHWAMPSIEDHWQNRGFKDWAYLIELTRDAWKATFAVNSAYAHGVAFDWWNRPHTTFKRLALYAASQVDAANPLPWVDWLTSSNATWLWSSDMRRETMRLLVLRGGQLQGADLVRLEKVVLKGPSRELYRVELEPDRWKNILDHSVWLVLEKLELGGARLTAAAKRRLSGIRARNPDLKLADDESDEFSHWMTGTGDPDFRSRRQIEKTPLKIAELLLWLQASPSDDFWHEDDWRGFCRENFCRAALVLHKLSLQGVWPIKRWQEAFQAWNEDDLLILSWKNLATTIQRMPDEVMIEVADGISWWLQAITKVSDEHSNILIAICQRIITLGFSEEGPSEQPVSDALNHPIGHVTQALLNKWFRGQPQDGSILPNELELIFTTLCDRSSIQNRNGRVLLASHVIALYRVDRLWTTKHLLPLFDWRLSPVEAVGCWKGFLWSPRIYGPLFTAVMHPFLDTANHYLALGDHGKQYATILTYAALDVPELFNARDLRAAIATLPQQALDECAQALVYALEGSGDQAALYWRNRVLPFWNTFWPKGQQNASKQVAMQLARLTIAAKDAFPDALRALESWLQPVEHPDYLIHKLRSSDLCSLYPESALKLLGLVISDQSWAPEDLSECLSQILQAMPNVSSTSTYQKLFQFSRERKLG